MASELAVLGDGVDVVEADRSGFADAIEGGGNGVNLLP
jgi:hypothetical protein